MTDTDKLAEARRLAKKVAIGSTPAGRRVIDYMALDALLNLLTGDKCPGCGSPGPQDECDPDCDYGECPNPECDFKGSMNEHIDAGASGSGPGFTGARIYWWTFKCGFQEFDGSADNLEAAR